MPGVSESQRKAFASNRFRPTEKVLLSLFLSGDRLEEVIESWASDHVVLKQERELLEELRLTLMKISTQSLDFDVELLR